MAEEEDFEQKKKKKNASKYNYSFGDTYPGLYNIEGAWIKQYQALCQRLKCFATCLLSCVLLYLNRDDDNFFFLSLSRRLLKGVKIGHKACLRFAQAGYPVPAKMGWLWNVREDTGMKVRKGWTPGAIGKSIAKLMTFKCPKAGKDKDRKKKKRKPGQAVGAGDSEPEEPLEPKPALKVKRKGDTFIIEVNPLKDLRELALNEDPYVECDPLIFKIIKKRSPEEQAKVEARRMAKLKKQRDAEVRRQLAEAVEDICKCAYMDIYCNDLTAIDKVIDSCPAFKEPDCICQDESLSSLSSNATWDIEYTPPFGCFDLAPRKCVNYVHIETQYIPLDAGIVLPPKGVKSQKPCAPQRTKKCRNRTVRCSGRCR